MISTLAPMQDAMEQDDKGVEGLTAIALSLSEIKSSSNHEANNATTSRLKPQPRAKYSFEHRILLNLLIEARKASGISQKALSRRLGKPLSHLSFVEGGDRDLTFVEVARICDIVGLPLTKLAEKFSQQVNETRSRQGSEEPTLESSLPST